MRIHIWFRIQLITLMWILMRIQVIKMMRIHTDPDPRHRLMAKKGSDLFILRVMLQTSAAIKSPKSLI
jgi:hypothetical protein